MKLIDKYRLAAILFALALPIAACDNPQAPPVEQEEDEKDEDGKTQDGIKNRR